MYKIEIGTIKEVLDNVPLLAKHWDEVARDKELCVLLPDYQKYAALEKLGHLLTLVARVNGILVGYSVTIIDSHLHYADVIVGTNDVLFVHPDYRSSPLGLRLIKRTEEECEALGVNSYSWRAKEGTPLHRIFEAKRYYKHEINYTKRLGKGEK